MLCFFFLCTISLFKPHAAAAWQPAGNPEGFKNQLTLIAAILRFLWIPATGRDGIGQDRTGQNRTGQRIHCLLPLFIM